MRKGFGVLFCLLIFVLAGRDLRAETRIFWMAQGPMASDFDGNGVVGFTDFLILVNSFNTQSGDETFDPRVDLDGNGRMEIVVPSFDDRLYVYNHDGTPFNPGSAPWPKELGFSDGTIASVSAGDIDGDSDLEIVVVGDDIRVSRCFSQVVDRCADHIGFTK